MTETRQQIADVLLTAAVVGVGLVTGNPVIATVVGGIGINWASELTRGGWQAACQKLLGSSGLLNHDLQQALARAFRQALAHLEQAWWETPNAKHMRRVEPEVARETVEIFKMLREDTAAFCCADGLGRAAGNEQVRQLLYGDETTARRALAGCLSDYLHGHDPNLIAFLDAHLVQALAFWFGEELKADRPESNRAWRAFQRLLLEGLQTSLTEVQAGQRDTQRILENLRGDLQAWADRMDALSADVRERTGEAALLQALTGMRDELLAAIATEAGLTRTAIETAAERITLLFSEDLARLRGDLLPLLGKRGLVEGQAPLRADLRGHFDALLQDYALFGGRAEELAAIHTFLADPQGGYLFITGPSGYGKTALLVQLALKGETAYHFFSRAYDTAGEDLFLRNLCQQLAARHGLGGQLPVSTAELRALYPDLLRLPPADGQPVVVLIDGLDEAANWEPGPLHFPTDVPDGVKVIFSARQVADQDWLARLRLPRDRIRQLTLGAMTAEDVRSLLLAAGGPAAPLADAPGWIAQALRVSAGDPFYLKLLIEDVRDGRMLPNQIEAQPEGLDSYLERWYLQVANAATQQNYEYHHDLLGCLSAARGPLGRHDLIEMFPRLNMILAALPAELRRFIVGDKDTGYALCHPRLADYVQSTFARRELQAYRDTLVAYCAGWREHHSPYALAHYAGHLAEARRWEELHTLVATGNERQEWAEARFAAEGSYAGYLADLGLAWAQSRATVHKGEDAGPVLVALARSLHYALIASSINTIAGNYEPALVWRAVEAGQWTTVQVLGVGARVLDAEKRAAMYTAILATGTLPAAEHQAAQEGALAAVQAIEHEWKHVKALAALAPWLTGAVRAQALEAGLIAALAFEDERVRAHALAALAPQLTGELLMAALAAAQAIENEKHRAVTLRALAPQLTGELLAVTLTAAQMIENEYYRARVLAKLAPQLAGEAKARVLETALAAAQTTRDEYYRARVLAELAPQLMGEAKARALEAALAAAQTIEKKHNRAQALAALAPQLAGEAKAQALAASLVAVHAGELPGFTFAGLLETEAQWARVNALAALAPQLTDELLADALAMAQAIENEWARARVLAALAPQLTGESLAVALTAAQAIGDGSARAEALAALAPRLTSEARAQTLVAALAEARAIGEEWDRVEALAALAPRLTGEAKAQALTAALAAAHATRNEWSRAELLVKLSPQLTGEAKAQALAGGLAAAYTIENEWARAKTLAELVPQLAGEAGAQALEAGLVAALALEDEQVRAERLKALAPHLVGELPAIALTAAQALKNEGKRADVLSELAPQLTGELLAAALTTALAIKSEWARAWSLAALAPQLADEAKTQALAAALAAAQETRDEYYRARVLAALAPQLTGETKEQTLKAALTAAQATRDEWDRVDALAALAPQLTGDLLEVALATAQTIGNEWHRARALAALAPQLSGELLAIALAATQTIEFEWHRVDALRALAPQLTGDLLAVALATAQTIEDGSASANALVALAPQLAGELLEVALTAAKAIGKTQDRARALAALAPQLTGEARAQALEAELAAAQAIKFEEDRADALRALAPRLTDELLVDALAAAKAIESEYFRADALAALAPQLPGELLPDALAAAQAIENEYYRARALAALATPMGESEQMYREIRRVMADHLWHNLQFSTRDVVLQFCAEGRLWVPPIVTTETVATIARAVVDVGRWWP